MEPPVSAIDRRNSVDSAALSTRIVDPADQLVELDVRGGVSERGFGVGIVFLLAWSVIERGKQQVDTGWLQSLEDLDSSSGGRPDYPGCFNAGGVVFAFEGQAGDLPPIGISRIVTLDTQASAAEVFKFTVPHS
jgi:hypothetical protein